MNAVLNAWMPHLVDVILALTVALTLLFVPWALWLPSPLALLSRFWRALAEKLGRADRGADTVRARGWLVTLSLLIAGLALGGWIDQAPDWLHSIAPWLVPWFDMLLLLLVIDLSRPMALQMAAASHLKSLPRAEASMRLGRLAINMAMIALADRVLIAMTAYVIGGWQALVPVMIVISALDSAAPDAATQLVDPFFSLAQHLYRLLSYPLVLPGALMALLVTTAVPGASGGQRIALPRGVLLGLRGIMVNMTARRLGLAIEPGGVFKGSGSVRQLAPLAEKTSSSVILPLRAGQQVCISLSAPAGPDRPDNGHIDKGRLDGDRIPWVGADKGRARVSLVDIRRAQIGWLVAITIAIGFSIGALQWISSITGRLPSLL